MTAPGRRDGSTAAVVCEHIADQRCPILSAFRTEPDSPEDSGWQFFCGNYQHEDPGLARVWLLKEVLELEPSLRDHMGLPAGKQVWRPNTTSDWHVRDFE
jgi:hypothetical protein